MAFNWLKKRTKKDALPIDESPAVTEQLKKVGQEPDATFEASDFEVALDDNRTDMILPSDEAEEVVGSSVAQTTTEGKGFFARLKQGLTKTRDILTTNIEDLFHGKMRIDDEMLENLEEMLITSDIGVQTTTELMNAVTRKASQIGSPQELKQVIKDEILAIVEAIGPAPGATSSHKPHVIMVIGVNGVGKTTTIGKLAARMSDQGHQVLIAAADTFRAAAIEQLAIWAQRAQADLIRHKDNADPAAVVFDSLEAAQARGKDIVLVDTAGRLHTKVNLMEELKKIKRTITRKIPDAPHEVLLVLDATTGQNAVSQAKLFNASLGVTGLILTKLDGTAKGGVVISICRELNLPLHYIGVGESIEDLQPFNAQQFVEALF